MVGKKGVAGAKPLETVVSLGKNQNWDTSKVTKEYCCYLSLENMVENTGTVFKC